MKAGACVRGRKVRHGVGRRTGGGSKNKDPGFGYLGVFKAPDRWIGNSALSATSSRWLVLKSSVVCNWALFWKIDMATDRKDDKSLGEVVG